MKVLISAYACEPNKGSEPGAGWNWSVAAARDNEVWVLTRSNNREAIEAELALRPVPSLHFVYIDLPRTLSFWKRRQRGVRLYYSLWQFAAFREARRLQAEIGFDLVHHITFANAWLPAGVAYVDAPFLLGPVDAGLTIPVRLYRELGPRGVLAEWKAETVRAVARVNPVTRRGIKRARLIIAQNHESAERLRSFSRPVVVRPNASVDRSQLLNARTTTDAARDKTAIVAGRLVAWKGVALAIRAIALLPAWKLEIIGSGPDEPRLRRLVRALGIERRVTFVAWLPQVDLWRRMAGSAVVLVPSLRDAANLVVAEAATLGIPVVALDQGGPRALARSSPGSVRLVPRDTPSSIVHGLASEIQASGFAAFASDAFGPERLASDLAWIYESTVRSHAMYHAHAVFAGRQP